MVMLIFYLLLIVFPKWVELKPHKLIMLKFSVPKALICDLRSHFYNNTMSTLLQKVVIAYHPQTNGQTEMFIKEFKQILQCRNVTWPLTKRARKESFNCKNLRSFAWRPMRSPRFTKKW
ncbi:hypothetical protein CR513_62198, partial [Mucuna pruriens]